jgi:asparagine synthase (glutamine-hydrolysing)
VIAHLYEEHGDAFVHQLNGMFAIALWDSRQRRLLLVRDRLGIKPLYWTAIPDERIAFGSELKAVMAAGEIDRRVDLRALKDYLTFGHVPAPRTIFEGVHKLEPGHLLSCTQQRGPRSANTGTSLQSTMARPAISAKQRWIDEFTGLLEDAVSLRLEADVPLGAFLSGGVDSAAVVAAMCRAKKGSGVFCAKCSPNRPNKLHPTPFSVLTHTVGFDEACHDERSQARRIAGLLGTDHHEFSSALMQSKLLGVWCSTSTSPSPIRVRCRRFIWPEPHAIA